jgi:hypothetical protein
VDFLSINADSRGRADAQANAIFSNGGHNNPDLLADHDLFTDTPAKH